ncbi:NAD(P)H-dependent oxidoreductase [Lysobacter firmicutimachus]|uniref:NAD(P)H-dependent oxidoreductase n=1 Tax=Lysobacter firmicutimachus TaxID=1792846 RepID=A0AAU8MU74_9GAMM
MHALIVVAHPDPQSLTHVVAARLAAGLAESGHRGEIADLAAEGFDPRFNAADIEGFYRRAEAPADVLAEQARIDRADALALVFPVYWWSMPGLLKGWVDRVFANGWAYDEADGRVVKKLQRLEVHLIGVGGAGRRTYAKHGYETAMKTQIDHGIFDYCGARVLTSELLLHTRPDEAAAQLQTAFDLGRGLFAEQALVGAA